MSCNYSPRRSTRCAGPNPGRTNCPRRCAVLKRADGHLTEAQVAALAELEASDLFTAIAWRIKEKLRWVRQAQSVQAARWRLTNFLPTNSLIRTRCSIRSAR